MADDDSTHVVISRQDAKAAGLRHYFTGNACKRGHLALRLVSTLQCCTCLYDRLKEWRRLHPEENRERDRKWRSKNADKRRKCERSRYAKNPKKFVEKSQRYYRSNAERIKKNRTERYYVDYKNEDVRRAAQERTRQWAKANPDRAKANARNGKAKRKSVVGKHSASDVQAIMTMQRGKCAYCKCRLSAEHHVDHIIPVARGGTNWPSNLQILCAPCNLSKGARDPIDHARMLGKLL